MPKQKIAILGGGIAALTTAFELTSTEKLRETYDITIYQMGWRLGGKVASGCNQDIFDRNEEHGLHVWFGYYDNAFAGIKTCYEEFAQLYPDYRFKTYLDAFKAQSFTPYGNYINNRYGYWDVTWPDYPGTPGEGGIFPEPWEAVIKVFSELKNFLHNQLEPDILELEHSLIPDWLEDGMKKLEHVGDKVYHNTIKALSERIHDALIGLQKTTDHSEICKALDWMLDEFRQKVLPIVEKQSQTNPDKHPLLSVIDIGISFFKGFINPKYGILNDLDLARIDFLDFREFLIDNGGNETIINESSWLRAIYDTAFQYINGDLSKPDWSAGTAARTLIRIVATSKGAVLWLPQSGFGEAVVSPYYKVLESRGVKFKFFHKVTDLKLTEDKNQIESVNIDIQAKTIDDKDYQPTFEHKQMVSWPSHPDWDQLVDGQAMKKDNINFESNWCQWPAAEQIELKLGQDFDIVVLGISLGAFKQLNSQDPSMCQDLIDAHEDFKDMTEQLNIVVTSGIQFWFNKTLEETGWDKKPATVGGAEPIDIWTDMSQIIATEGWDKAPEQPQSLGYLCGCVNTDLYKKPKADKEVPEQGKQVLKTMTLDWLNQYAYSAWPKISNEEGGIEWNTLYDWQNRQGEERLDAQFLRINIDPTEMCIGSPKGSIKYRMKPGNSGFSNLILTGDWCDMAINVCCVEGATMSGMMASRAICGYPEKIVGEYFMQAPVKTED